MKRGRQTVGSKELKTRLGTYLKRVREGATLVITDRGHPVAELKPLQAGQGGLERRLAELEAVGLVSRETRSRALRPFKPVANHGRLASDAVSEGREDRF
jgi:prevent-host-death family protein